MDRTAFKLRMLSLKTYREQNPDKGYWDWKVQTFENGGETIPIRGTSVYNNYGDTTHYIPASLEDNTLNLSLPDVVITPRNNLNLASVVTEGRNKIGRAGGELLSMTTPVGDVESVYEIGKDISTGNYSLAALGVGLMLLPNFIERPLQRGIRKINKYINADKRIYKLIDKLDDRSKELYDNLNRIKRDWMAADPNKKTTFNRDRIAKEYLSVNPKELIDNSKVLLDDFRNAYKEALLQYPRRILNDHDIPELYKSLYHQLYSDDPQYIDFTNAAGLPFWKLSTVDKWIDKQRTSIRGVYTDTNNANLDVLEPMFTLTKTSNPGGDRLDTSGGLYTSNSMEIADRFSRSMKNTDGTAAYAILRSPDINRNVSIREQLSQLRRRIYPYDISGGKYDLTQLKNRGYIGVQSQYTTGGGDKLPAYETAYIADEPHTILKVADIRDYKTSNVTKNIAGRWGNGAGGAGLTDELYSPRVFGNSLGDFIHEAKTYLDSNKELAKLKVPSDKAIKEIDRLYGIDVVGYDYFGEKDRYKQIINRYTANKNIINAKANKIHLRKESLKNLAKHSSIVSGTFGGFGASIMYTKNYYEDLFLDQNLLDLGVDDQLNKYGFNININNLPVSLKKKLYNDNKYKLGEFGKDYYTDLFKSYGINTYKNGGETGDNSPVRVNPYTGKPLASGAITPVMDLRTAADFTPIGDVLAVNDTYLAVKERDWTGAGLTALGVIPFVPSGLKNIRKASQRYIPTVNRNDLLLINEAFGKMAKKNSYLTDVANAKNRIFELLNSILYRNRASKVDEIYGTNYNETYDLVNDLYENDFFNLPEVKSINMEAAGRLLANRQATKRFKEEGIGAGPKDFELLVNPDLYRDPYELANHEINHYTDFIISRNANTSMNNKMLLDLEKSLKTTDDPSYFRKGTELKAYMNLLRTRMLSDGTISNIDEPVTSSTIKSYMSKLDDKDPIKRTFKQHKSANSYTKWFNTIPLLGIGALGINRYYTNNKNE